MFLLLLMADRWAGGQAASAPNSIPEKRYVGSSMVALDTHYDRGMPWPVIGLEGGGGLDLSRRSNPFAGVKFGGPFFAFDFQYDRIRSSNGFSTEVSGWLPFFRLQSPKEDEEDTKTFLKVYAEPGLGYRAGGGPFGGYGSAKMLFSVCGRKWEVWTPYVEIQHRFPFSGFQNGDTRFAIGISYAFCNQCEM